MASRAPSFRRDAIATRGADGFTLVELLTVVSILAVLAILAGPAFTELTAQQRVQVAATDLFTSLVRARSEAIKQNTDVTLSPPSGTWNAGWVVAIGGSNIDMHAATPNIAISGNVSPVIYRNSGRVSGTTPPKFTLSATQTSLKRCVAVRLSGEPVVTRAACP
ncbi:MAG: prepilin-type N-terminal cleavage/methylation domain-containing protein [Betaproteobacteria bacterium]|nr:MAG: prepilin-type N-terminal cleavage/methylation domain-containing protein [Betaproteobacteria bacterium]